MYPAPNFLTKICPPDQLANRVATLPRPLVFTNGCFDLLHAGHVIYLAQARALGATMLVAVNSDSSVKRQGKGVDRPINTQQNRLTILAALESTTLVTWFDEDTPLNLIQQTQPDVLVKGGDWPIDKIVGAAEVQHRGGHVHAIPFIIENSTTAIIQRIRNPDYHA